MFKRIRRSKAWHTAAAVVTAVAAGITSGSLNPDSPDAVALVLIIATAVIGFSAENE